MIVKRLHILEIEIFKYLMEETWILWQTFLIVLATQLIRNITSECAIAPHQDMVTKAIAFLRHRYGLLFKTKKFATSSYKFKEFIKPWCGCKCYLCFYWPMSYFLYQIHTSSNLFNTSNNIFTHTCFIYTHKYLTLKYFNIGLRG